MAVFRQNIDSSGEPSRPLCTQRRDSREEMEFIMSLVILWSLAYYALLSTVTFESYFLDPQQEMGLITPLQNYTVTVAPVIFSLTQDDNLKFTNLPS